MWNYNFQNTFFPLTVENDLYYCLQPQSLINPSGLTVFFPHAFLYSSNTPLVTVAKELSFLLYQTTTLLVAYLSVVLNCDTDIYAEVAGKVSSFHSDHVCAHWPL